MPLPVFRGRGRRLVLRGFEADSTAARTGNDDTFGACSGSDKRTHFLFSRRVVPFRVRARVVDAKNKHRRPGAGEELKAEF